MSLRERACQAIQTALEAIEEPRLVLVTREPFEVEKLAITQFPALLLRSGSETRETITMGEVAAGRRAGAIEIVIRGFVRGTDLDTKRNDIIESVENAIDSDRYLGLRTQGIQDSQITAIEIIDRAPPLAEIAITVTVRYNYVRGTQ
jgi:hypothetical protein